MTFFNFFSNILITKGATRILISDLQRNISELHSLEFNDILEELKYNSIEDISMNFDLKSKKEFQKYLDFLLNKEYGFITENDWDKNFPPLSYEYINSSSISNLFAKISDISFLQKIKQSIEKLQVQHLIIHFDKKLSLAEIVGIDRIFEKSILQGIEIYSHYHKAINSTFINDLNLKTARIYNLVFYNCNEAPFQVEDKYRFDLTFTNQSIKMNSCGKVDLKYFNTNLPKVLEAINHNSCLHKKISIDSEGNIRNCPSMPQSFGNIKDTSLEEALNHKDFKKYWNIAKDEIEVCKNCEFRYICTDCRAYTEQTHKNKNGLDISKPLKCGYDPYIGEWEEWSTNPLKEKAIKFYGMQNLVKK